MYGAIKWFFFGKEPKFEEVYVENVFSDRKLRKIEDRFHSQPIEDIKWKSLIKGENIFFRTLKIVDIESDHKKEKYYPEKSYFVQFVDLIMGTFSQIFDNTSGQKGKCLAASKCLKFELPTRLMKYNPNSRYYKKYAISFFPKKKLTKKEILEGDMRGKVNQFYNERVMKYPIKNQLSFTFGK